MGFFFVFFGVVAVGGAIVSGRYFDLVEFGEVGFKVEFGIFWYAWVE